MEIVMVTGTHHRCPNAVRPVRPVRNPVRDFGKYAMLVVARGVAATLKLVGDVRK